MSDFDQHPNENQAREELAQARAAIESAIAVIRTHRASMTEGQLNDIKRIIYNVPRLY